jgi:serine protease AprX
VTRLVRIYSRALLACVLASTAASASAEPRQSHSKTDLAVQRSLRSGASKVKVIITVSDPADRQSIRQALAAHGDTIKSEHPLVGALAAEVHASDVAQLAKHPGVQFVSADAVVSAGGADFSADWGSTSSSSSSSDWGVPAGGGSALRLTLGLSPVARTGPTGRGVGVALIDSGITPSFDFGFRVTGFFDFTKGGVPAFPSDDYGHGTHVAGLIGSNGLLSGFVLQGVAPDVNFVALKVLDANGQGSTSDVIKAIEYVVANRQRLGVQIINLSLGHPIYAAASNDPLVQAVERASTAGLIVVASAGNFGQSSTTGNVGYAGTTSPGNAPSAITVGCAVTRGTPARGDDRVAAYSSRGPSWYDAFVKPNIVAPGHALASDTTVNSTLYKVLTANRQKVGVVPFLQLSGTSMAAGVTTGVVALVLEANQNAQYRGGSPLSPNLVKAILEYSAIPLSDDSGAVYDVLTQGTGELNAQGAIALASAIDTSARYGDFWLRNSVPTQTIFAGVAWPWAMNVVWGNNVVWGDVVLRNAQAWATGIVWGSDNVVWGDAATATATNIVWADAAVWAANVVWGNTLIGVANGQNVVWSNLAGDNIVWGNLSDDNIVWGNLFDDNIVWGNSYDDNIVWGNGVDNIVWGNSAGPAPGGGLF